MSVGVFLAWLSVVRCLGQFSVIEVDPGWGCSKNCARDQVWYRCAHGVNKEMCTHRCLETRGSASYVESHGRTLRSVRRQEEGKIQITRVFTGRNRKTQDRYSE